MWASDTEFNSIETYLSGGVMWSVNSAPLSTKRIAFFITSYIIDPIDMVCIMSSSHQANARQDSSALFPHSLLSSSSMDSKPFRATVPLARVFHAGGDFLRPVLDPRCCVG